MNHFEVARNWSLKITVTIVIAGSLFATFSGFEIFPFSPYPMYSKPVKTEPHYSYYRFRIIKENGDEEPFYNSEFGIFHYNQQLEESFIRNHRAGKTPQVFVESIYKTISSKTPLDQKSFVGLRLYEIQVDWSQYKNCFLAKLENCKNLKNFSNEILLAEVKD